MAPAAEDGEGGEGGEGGEAGKAGEAREEGIAAARAEARRGMRKPKKKLKLKTKRARREALQAHRHRQGEARPFDEAPHPDQEGHGPEARLRKSTLVSKAETPNVRKMLTWLERQSAAVS